MSDRKMKAEASPILLMVGVLVLALVFGAMAIPINELFSSEMDESIGDLDRVATTKSSAQLYFYNYVPTAATYAAYQESFELGRRGGSKDIDWSSDLYTESENQYPGYVYNPGQTCSSDDVVNEITCRLGDNVTEELRERYISGSEDGRCQRPDYNLDVYFSQEDYSLEGSAFALSPIETRCNFPDGNVRYQANNSFLSLDFDVSGNRYIKLAEEADRITEGLYNEWSSGVDDNYVGTETQCNNKDFESAEEEAVNDAESDIDQAFDDAPDSSDISDIVVQAFEVTGPSTTFSEGTSTDAFKGSDSQSSEVVGDCNCDEDGDNCDPVYEAEVNVTVDRSDMELVLIDEFSKIPVDLGKRTLEFRVDEYQHFYQED